MNKKGVFGTFEWANHNENIISGCAHDCLYCYSKEMAIRFKRKTPENWRIEEVNFKKIEKNYKKYDGRVMFPSSHDITPGNLFYSIKAITSLLSKGNKLLIVSKPHFECIKRICKKTEMYRDNILFRFTIGSPKTETLKFWEPFAPSFEERFKALTFAFKNDFNTSLSIEPILDNIENIELLIKKILPFIADSIWIGKPNYLLRRLKMNGCYTPEIVEKAEQLERWCSNSEIEQLYRKYKKNKKIKWKESIKKIIGLEIPVKKGLDI